MDNSNTVAGIFGLWMLLGLGSIAALIFGGLYALYCLTRTASGMERVAAAVEELAMQEKERRTVPLPGLTEAVPFTPPAHPPVLEPIVLEDTRDA